MANDTKYDLSLSAPYFREVKATLEAWDPKVGLTFTQKKFRSSRRIRTFVAPENLVYFKGKVGGEGFVGYCGAAIQPALEDISNTKLSSGGFYTGQDKNGDPVLFSTTHLGMTAEIKSVKKVKNGKLKKEGKKGKKVKAEKVKTGKKPKGKDLPGKKKW